MNSKSVHSLGMEVLWLFFLPIFSTCKFKIDKIFKLKIFLHSISLTDITRFYWYKFTMSAIVTITKHKLHSGMSPDELNQYEPELLKLLTDKVKRIQARQHLRNGYNLVMNCISS